MHQQAHQSFLMFLGSNVVIFLTSSCVTVTEASCGRNATASHGDVVRKTHSFFKLQTNYQAINIECDVSF